MPQGQSLAGEEFKRKVGISMYLMVSLLFSVVGVRLLFEPDLVVIGISMVGLGAWLTVGYVVLRAINRQAET